MAPVNVNVNMDATMDAIFMSYTLPLPDSIGSVSNFVTIDRGANRGQDQDHLPHPMVFRYRFVGLFSGTLRIRNYLVVNPIGFYKNSAVMVYKAARVGISVSSSLSDTMLGSQDTFCALKVVDKDSPESIVLKEQVASMENCWHKNLLGIAYYSNWFVDEESKKFVCFEIPHFPVSVRTIMKNRFPRGLPQDLILSVLRSVLNALQYLYGHQKRKKKIMHRDIQAGHIYLCGKGGQICINPYQIKLGYGASVFDEGEEEMDGPDLPMASMSKWAAAPEVYYGNGNQSYSEEKADIWMIGITALELAYGGLKVSNRNALETIIKDIKLPPSKTAKYYAKKLLFSSASSSSKVNEELLLSSEGEENYCKSSPLYSRSFFKMVKQCLTWDPKKRPTINWLLLSHPLFLADIFTFRREACIWDHFINKTSS